MKRKRAAYYLMVVPTLTKAQRTRVRAVVRHTLRFNPDFAGVGVQLYEDSTVETPYFAHGSLRDASGHVLKASIIRAIWPSSDYDYEDYE